MCVRMYVRVCMCVRTYVHACMCAHVYICVYATLHNITGATQYEHTLTK